jgi:hypothetical protein
MNLAQLDTGGPEMRSQCGLVEHIDSKAEMVHVSGRSIRRHRNRYQIDERPSRAEVIQTEILTRFFKTATQHATIKVQHALHIDAANDDMIDSDDLHIHYLPIFVHLNDSLKGFVEL